MKKILEFFGLKPKELLHPKFKGSGDERDGIVLLTKAVTCAIPGNPVIDFREVLLNMAWTASKQCTLFFFFFLSHSFVVILSN